MGMKCRCGSETLKQERFHPYGAGLAFVGGIFVFVSIACAIGAVMNFSMDDLTSAAGTAAHARGVAAATQSAAIGISALLWLALGMFFARSHHAWHCAECGCTYAMVPIEKPAPQPGA